MSALILLAPNPRVGYLLYPVNFFVWAYLLAEPASPLRRGRPMRRSRRTGMPGRSRPSSASPSYIESLTWKRRMVKSVSPCAGPPEPNVVGERTAPISQ